ncbi:NAD-dependent epimerase/dehydratase family protein [Hoeflea sp.]|uniref:NAD-dependent epimerase/dehydratase family protein n=1 Tax=Hoeflea sp. TaxID=1940281 RepID=UPI003A91866C
MSRWFVTGGNGFIGSNLVTLLAGAPGTTPPLAREIVIYDSTEAPASRPIDALRQAAGARGNAPDITCITGDILDRPAMAEAMAGADYVVHLAASSNVNRSVEDPFFDHQNNVIGTLNTLDAARMAGVKRLVFASSSAPLANAAPPIHEDMAPDLGNPYAAGKLAGEAYCQAFSSCYGLQTTVLRFSNVFGPYSDRSSGVIPTFIRKLLASEPIEIYGDGSATRDFIHVSDICAVIAKAATDQRPSRGEVFHVATKAETSILKVATLLVEAMRARGFETPELLFKPERVGDVPRSFSENSKARQFFNWQPRTTLEKDIGDLVDWFVALKTAQT